MEYRKIIEFGKSSFVVSLPKDWLSEKNLGKGDVVYVSKQGNNLVFYPAKSETKREPREVTIDVSDFTCDEIKLILISHYIRNFNKITLTSKNMKAKAKDIRAIIHDMMALEVIEEDSSKIVTKDFIHTEDIVPIELIKKMDRITREMIIDSKRSFEEEQYQNLSERDTDVNRLSYLLFRSLRSFEQNPQHFRRLGMTNSDFLAQWTAGVKIERVADDVKRISKLMRRLNLSKNEKEQFVKLYSQIERYYVDCMEVFYEKDPEKALKLVMQKRLLIKKCRDFYRVNWNHEWVPVILEKFKAMIAGSKSLMTYVIDI